ncbi:MAG TPA: universal stress protein [Anaeromyxobacteraceae bacterium]|nr:universal stress protein [Anaeromyxobacteraceae bacterium]
MAALELRRILCPVDFSDASSGALRAAASLAARFGGTVTLLHIDAARGSSIPEAMLETPPEVANDFSAPADRPLLEWKALAERLGAPSVELRRSVGRPEQEIVALAKREPFDLIVLGTHGRGGISHFVVGSVAEEVVRHAPCPVLTIGGEAAKRLGS